MRFEAGLEVELHRLRLLGQPPARGGLRARDLHRAAVSIDWEHIWHLSPSDALLDFCPYGDSSVASLRHSNGSPLIDRALLDRASITDHRTPGQDRSIQPDGS